jgi:hypothetical protein
VRRASGGCGRGDRVQLSCTVVEVCGLRSGVQCRSARTFARQPLRSAPALSADQSGSNAQHEYAHSRAGGVCDVGGWRALSCCAAPSLR